MRTSLLLVLLTAGAACSGSHKEAGGGSHSIDAETSGDETGSGDDYVLYTAKDRIFRIEARRGATPVELSAALDDLSSGGEDESPAASRNGRWLTLTTTRFGCDDSCLALVRGDAGAGERVEVDGDPLQPKGRAAVSDDGRLLVYPQEGGPHAIDLYALRRGDDGWGKPALLTGTSPHAYNVLPVLSRDGERVLFDCGPEPYSGNGTGICEVSTGGLHLRRIVAPGDNPLGGSGPYALHHADYAADGSIVFEADWSGEQIWKLEPGAPRPVRIDRQFNNDNTPCVLPSGKIASLWLNRPGGQGVHELKVMAPGGGDYAVLTPDLDITDVGLGCLGLLPEDRVTNAPD